MNRRFYGPVTVFLLKWKYEREGDGFTEEVSRLEDVFFSCYDQYIHLVEIPLRDGLIDPRVELIKTLIGSVHGGLIIFIYTGHAESVGNQLYLEADKARGNGSIKFTETYTNLDRRSVVISRPVTDLLLILDCCKGGLVCEELRSSRMVNGRTYVIASTSWEGSAPLGRNSFAMQLAEELEKHPKKGFTVTELYDRMKARVPEAVFMRPSPKTYPPTWRYYDTEDLIVKPRGISKSECLELRGEAIGTSTNPIIDIEEFT